MQFDFDFAAEREKDESNGIRFEISGHDMALLFQRSVVSEALVKHATPEEQKRITDLIQPDVWAELANNDESCVCSNITLQNFVSSMNAIYTKTEQIAGVLQQMKESDAKAWKVALIPCGCDALDIFPQTNDELPHLSQTCQSFLPSLQQLHDERKHICLNLAACRFNSENFHSCLEISSLSKNFLIGVRQIREWAHSGIQSLNRKACKNNSQIINCRAYYLVKNAADHAMFEFMAKNLDLPACIVPFELSSIQLAHMLSNNKNNDIKLSSDVYCLAKEQLNTLRQLLLQPRYPKKKMPSHAKAVQACVIWNSLCVGAVSLPHFHKSSTTLYTTQARRAHKLQQGMSCATLSSAQNHRLLQLQALIDDDMRHRIISPLLFRFYNKTLQQAAVDNVLDSNVEKMTHTFQPCMREFVRKTLLKDCSCPSLSSCLASVPKTSFYSEEEKHLCLWDLVLKSKNYNPKSESCSCMAASQSEKAVENVLS